MTDSAKDTKTGSYRRGGPKSKFWAGLNRFFLSATPYDSQIRLEAQISELESRLKAFRSVRKGKDTDREAEVCLALIDDFIASAQSEICANYVEAGWLHFNAALRSEVELQTDPKVVESMITALAEESKEKLKNWRGPAVNTLLARAKNLTDAELSAKKTLLAQALELRDLHFDNMYRNKEILKRHIGVLLIPLLIGAFGFLVVLFFGNPDFNHVRIGTERIPGIIPTVFGAAFLGLMGASLSALTGMVNSDRVPSQFDHIRITLARACTGLVTGMVAYLVVKVGWIKGFETPAHLWLLAFGFGFSEKLFLGVMDRLGKKK